WSRNRVASAHFGVDNNSTVMYVPIDEVAWHAAGVNSFSVGIEQAATARQTAEQWADPYSSSMINTQTVPLVAWLCMTLGIPVRFVDAAGINRGEAGITTHHEVSKAKKGTHWDPGPNYPLHEVLAKVDAYIRNQGGKPAATPPASDLGAALRAIADIIENIKRHPVRKGSRGVEVELVQKLL